VDAITLGMARLAGGQITGAEATAAILLAASVNTGVKAVMAGYLGGGMVGRIVGGVSALALLALGATYALAPPLGV
jgi:uncharacterized membrane protein (DUF4010 family)